MLKTMIFLDGSWFDAAVKRICLSGGEDRIYIEHVQFAPINQGIVAHIKGALGFDVDLVRTYCAAGHPDPETVGPRSRDHADRIAAGWAAVKKTPCMALELFPYNYGRREFPAFDDRTDGFVAKEKCVDVALATKMLYFAAIPAAYDVAVLITGDRDYVPVLHAVRSLGKRTMLASFLDLPSCSQDLKTESAMGDLWDIPALDLAPALKRNGDGQAAR